MQHAGAHTHTHTTHMTEGLHLVQNPVDLWHDVFAVHVDGRVRAITKGNVENSTTLHTQKLFSKVHSLVLFVNATQTHGHNGIYTNKTRIYLPFDITMHVEHPGPFHYNVIQTTQSL